MSLAGFGAELAAGLAEMRQLAESRMRGTCTIRRPIPGLEELDPVLPGRVVPAYEPEPIYVDACYTRYPGLAHEQNPVFAGATDVVSRVIVRIKFGVVVRPGDVVTIDSDPDNPQLVGTSLRVASIDDQSQATAQRLLCEDFQAGGDL